MQLINESYKIKGPSSSSLGPKIGASNTTERANDELIQFDQLLQLSDINNNQNDVLDSQDTPKLGNVPTKNVNKTRFMRISENQSEEASQEHLQLHSLQKNSGQITNSKTKNANQTSNNEANN